MWDTKDEVVVDRSLLLQLKLISCSVHKTQTKLLIEDCTLALMSLNGIELEIICLDQEDEQKMKVDQLVGADFLV